MVVTSHYCAHNMQHKFVTLSLTNDPNNDPHVKDDKVFNYAHNFSTSHYLDLPNNKTPNLLFEHLKGVQNDMLGYHGQYNEFFFCYKQT